MLLALAPFAVSSQGCSKKRYHWERVPYCASPSGDESGGHFTTNLRVLTRHDKGGGTSTLHGMRSLRSVEFDPEVLVAVVACDSDALLPDVTAKSVASQLDEATVPEICKGQRLVTGPVRVSAKPTPNKRYQGALEFPPVPKQHLQCSAGNVAFGSGVP
jgi:hypothetical protein